MKMTTTRKSQDMLAKPRLFVGLKSRQKPKGEAKTLMIMIFFNELHHEGVSALMINNMNEGLSYLNTRYGLEWDGVTFISPLIIFTLKKNHEYFDATIKATYDVTSSFNDVVLLKETITPDFTRLYSNDRFKMIIREMEEKTNTQFHFCRLLIVDYEFMVSAVFDIRGYIVDLENMKLVE